MLAILTTHPIQYQVPLWQALARDGRIPFEVWYLTKHATDVSRDREFGKSFAWDLDMLSGYPHRFLDVSTTATPNSFWNCRLTESLAQRMRAANVKAIWIQGWQVAAYWQAVWSAKKIGVEGWLRGESNDLAPVPMWKHVIKRLLLGELFRHVDRFLYIGKANRRLYERYGVPSERLYPAPYAVDNERFAGQANAIRGQKAEIRRQWSIPENSFCVLFCGKFIAKKRPMDLIQAARLLLTSKRLPNIHLLFVGSGELGDQLRAECRVVYDEELVQRSEIGDRRSEKRNLTSDFRPTTSGTKPPASFTGFLNQTEIPKAYVAADCLVLPSDYGETWGLVVNEAMASGLSCVISDQCGCAEDLGSLGSNKISLCGNHPELAEKILKVSEDKANANRAEPPSFSTTIATIAALFRCARHRQSG